MTSPLVAAHYMSWFQVPWISGSWGFWSVNRPTIPGGYWHDPGRRDDRGRRDISSVYYPVIGPYDSADPDLCEYHILLAKLAGIDAFIADWYGPEPSAEHPYDNIGFLAMKSAAERLGFKVMICWEDRSCFPPISPAVATREGAVARGREMMAYLRREWFSSPAYLHLDGRPVLTNFAWGDPGPGLEDSWFNAAEWNAVFEGGGERPCFIHDWHDHRTVNEFEEYDSVMPWGSAYHGAKDAVPGFWSRAEAAMAAGRRFSFLSGATLPGFDNRGCGGWGTDGAIGVTERRNGEKFEATWRDVRAHDVRFVQVATWNDLNEGGTIEPVLTGVNLEKEPAEGYGYRELETVQRHVAAMKGCAADPAALRVPARIYLGRKLARRAGDASGDTRLDEARSALMDGRGNESRRMLDPLLERLARAVPDRPRDLVLLEKVCLDDSF